MLVKYLLQSEAPAWPGIGAALRAHLATHGSMAQPPEPLPREDAHRAWLQQVAGDYPDLYQTSPEFHAWAQQMAALLVEYPDATALGYVLSVVPLVAQMAHATRELRQRQIEEASGLRRRG